MNKIKLILMSAMAACLICGRAQAQITMVKGGKATARIVVMGDNPADMKAAALLQRFVGEISGAKLPIAQGTDPVRKGDIVIATCADPQQQGGNAICSASELQNLTQDGFAITCDGSLKVIARSGSGTVYGVVTLLERYLGMNYWSEDEYSLTQTKDIAIPALRLVENPAFRYRQSQNYALADPVYKMWMRLEEPDEVFAGGYWVHTFNRLLPSAVYGKEHPEYYAYFNGQRHPGEASQLCLSNPEVFDIVADRIDSIFKANPGKNIISVSQNDGNNTFCTCPLCKAADDQEGSHSGSVIRFMNKLAARFPDKQISTLAYLYTMHPPKVVKPLPNVNIMLCDIDCDREVSLTENASGREFVRAMEGWSAISNNIFVWDYGINFDGYLSPFPNFHIMRDNIQLFKKNNVTMHFSQEAGSRGGDFSEMRTWIVSKLMWNPKADTDSLMQTFLKGYYGAAAPYLYRYIQVMQGALLGSRERLWIYDSPVTFKKGMLQPQLMSRYKQFFDDAEEAVASDAVLLNRVRRSRLTLQFSELEIARTEQNMDTQDITRKLDLFEQRARLFHVPTLNERNNTPADYCNLYRERYMGKGLNSLALNAPVKFIVEPTGRYAALGRTALTDGLFGGTTYVESWVGWEGIDGEFVIDLGAQKQITQISTDFLQQLGAWILLPTKVQYAISDDGVKFTPAGTYDIAEDRTPQVKFVAIGDPLAETVKARYIKVNVTGLKICPTWHYGVGNPCWFFIDEVTVR